MRLLAAFLLLIAPLLNAQPGIEGTWQGDLQSPGGTLRLRLKIDRDGDGWKGTMDSLDQRAHGIPLEEVRYTEGRLSWKISGLGVGFTGTLKAAEDLIAGQFTQRGAALPLELKRMAATAMETAAPKRPQTPMPPFPYRTEDVMFVSKDVRVKLAGTLTTPQGRGPFPCLLLVSGSGAQDRDGTMFGHKPFAVIADYLARHGVAALRYDDRGIGRSTGEFLGATTADFALDAEGGIDYLLQRTEFGMVGIAGHSEGALIAPMVAGRRREIRFAVMLAGAGVNGEAVLLSQAAAILRADGSSKEAIESNRKIQEALFAIARSRVSSEEMLRQARAQFGSNPGVDQQVKAISDPWFRYFLVLDPSVILQKVLCPVLVLNGELDTQVVADQNLSAVEAALRKGGNRQVSIQRFARLNHLFQTATTGSPSEYNRIEETISLAVLQTILNWIEGVVK